MFPRRYFVVLIALNLPDLLVGQNLNQKIIDSQMVRIEEFILNMNEEFMDPEKSPLVKDSIPGFHGLDYYPISSDFIFLSSFEKIEDGRRFEMRTTTDRLPLYKDFAILTFQYQGAFHTLHAYQNVEISKKEGYEDHLFLPFTDHTNGSESYGGGRYIDLRIPKGDSMLLDFNQSYNPYCAYNPKYSCPIPPKENKLDFSVVAGVKKYH